MSDYPQQPSGTYPGSGNHDYAKSVGYNESPPSVSGGYPPGYKPSSSYPSAPPENTSPSSPPKPPGYPGGSASNNTSSGYQQPPSEYSNPSHRESDKQGGFYGPGYPVYQQGPMPPGPPGYQMPPPGYPQPPSPYAGPVYQNLPPPTCYPPHSGTTYVYETAPRPEVIVIEGGHMHHPHPPHFGAGVIRAGVEIAEAITHPFGHHHPPPHHHHHPPPHFHHGHHGHHGHHW